MKSAGRPQSLSWARQFLSRFGFRHDLARNLACSFNQYDAFMGLELIESSLLEAGTCRYARAFGALQLSASLIR